jgi:hypothetical protein
MLGTFLDKLVGIFDRRFLIIYRSPTLILFSMSVGLLAALVGPTPTLDWWTHLSGTEQVLLAGGILVSITLFAYLLGALTSPLVRLYEGYWPNGWLASLFSAHQQKRLTTLEKGLAATSPAKGEPTPQQQRAYDRLYFTRYQRFPRDTALVKPTRLGNLLAAAEEYPAQLYQLDAVLWWPRLTPLLPKDFRTQIDGALTPVLALLNLSLVFIFLAFGGAIAILLSTVSWWWGLASLVGGLLLSWACYMAAVTQALDYGDLIRVAFDLYRHAILKQMGIAVPDNLISERLLWTALTNWLYYYTPPWDQPDIVAHMPQLAEPFYYDTNQMSLPKPSRKRGQPPLQM